MSLVTRSTSRVPVGPGSAEAETLSVCRHKWRLLPQRSGSGTESTRLGRCRCGCRALFTRDSLELVAVLAVESRTAGA
jgi:hypothetical protein